ncbi:hypothetical protein ENSA5_54890 [Enhygromyxa salina]|uniref:Lipoprotein n=1 Tax=Enhygromyxa salina TaxID=215803 RepID=A0A2S9XF75_9BACT|nr:hypothetical protein [Enhygromyxa salina]PRP91515.1 hypothetical protein ENSA5_54890 [Enhygromyxa salina]
MRRPWSLVTALAPLLISPLLLAGCKPKPPSGPVPICLAEVAGGTAVESEVQELPADIWFSILLQDFDRERRLPGDDPKDCTGSSSSSPTPPPLPAGEQPDEDAKPDVVAGCNIGPNPDVARLPTRPLTDEDVIINKGPDGMSLVWVQATHYDNGEASGPVAMVEWTQAGVAVRALGSLRAQTNKARMRIEMSGDQQILVVEGDECNAEVSKLCKRIMKLLPNINGRFATVPLKLEKDEIVGDIDPCLGDASFALFEQYTSDLPDGWIRKFEISRSVTFDKGTPLVSEQVVIKDQDPNQPDAPPQDFREASSDRNLVYQDRHFATRGSLWDDMINNYGSVAHDTTAEEDE